MILLDSDRLTILIHPGIEQHDRLTDRMATSADQTFATTIVNAEEQFRGWLAEINRYRTPHRQLSAYEGMRRYLAFLRQFPLMAFDVHAADEFDRLRRLKVRIGSTDLKIASIALVHNLLLLSANLRDFQQVPGLRVENWLKD
jgi:tRNA(fMet)-specific endonuclease VapC